MKKTITIILTILVLTFGFLIILKPKICLEASVTAILICGNIIIPSLYPFTFCVLYLNNCNFDAILKPIDKISKWLFKLNHHEMKIFILSIIGGYPLGAKLLNDSEIDFNNSKYMLNFCVNAGPAFIILAVGKGVFGSLKIGLILFFSHIISSIILAFLMRKKFKYTKICSKTSKINAIDNFVVSASNSANTVIKTCSFVILFSVISKYFEHFSKYFKAFSYISSLCEVTNSVAKNRNIITVSFLLGFAGICIWFQIFAIVKRFKINYFLFVVYRVLHGTISAFLTYFALKIFKISVQTLSNNLYFDFKPYINTPYVAISLIIMGIVLIISLYHKNFAGNILEDIV